jgi:hypothetical protein
MKLATGIALALLGLVLAVALTTAATELTSQRIGLQAEPLTAGDDLAPRAPQRPAPTATPATTTETETEGGDDGSGRGRGRGRGRGGDDDD